MHGLVLLLLLLLLLCRFLGVLTWQLRRRM
jgi:hypothetical protein